MKGHLRKMQRDPGPEPRYHLPVGDARLEINDYLGKTFTLRYTNEIQCIGCGRLTKKSFNQGYCYPCFAGLAACDICIVKPERCHYAAGTCREPEWAQQHCFQTHYVYLANTSGLKVGITRASQIPTRWIDQGAVAAMKLLRVSSRLLAGKAEVILAAHVKDKTDWRRMLSGPPAAVDLAQAGLDLLAQCDAELSALVKNHEPGAITRMEQPDITTIEYPVITYPDKVRSLNLDKEPRVTGILQGIKGQYLLLDTGVINIRKYGGYVVEI